MNAVAYNDNDRVFNSVNILFFALLITGIAGAVPMWIRSEWAAAMLALVYWVFSIGAFGACDLMYRRLAARGWSSSIMQVVDVISIIATLAAVGYVMVCCYNLSLYLVRY